MEFNLICIGFTLPIGFYLPIVTYEGGSISEISIDTSVPIDYKAKFEIKIFWQNSYYFPPILISNAPFQAFNVWAYYAPFFT